MSCLLGHSHPACRVHRLALTVSVRPRREGTLQLDGRDDPMNGSDTARARLIQTFRFLKRLNELRNPVPRRLGEYQRVLRIDNWPKHPCIVIGDGESMNHLDSERTGQGIEPLIRIGRATLTPCPEPPQELEPWLNCNWESAEMEVDVVQHKDSLDPNTHTMITETFDEVAERVAAFENWKAIRREWAEKEILAVVARRVFETIYMLYTTMQRDGDRLELILADGMLYLRDFDIQHPILLQSVSLIFDPKLPEFSFITDIDKIELHSAMLRQLSLVETKMIAELEREIEYEPIEPLGGEQTRLFFRRVMQGLFKDGEFIEAKKVSTRSSTPCLWREPVIFVRKRTAGLSTTLDDIIEDLESETSEVPMGLGRIMGIEAPETEDVHPNDVINESDQFSPIQRSRPEILFTKPTNSEQIEIATRVDNAKSIIVQGPPGTGKTHTIANLLGHLLSEGKTVLVTAHTTKALRVLREQVDEVLQPLCISVLHRDSKSQGQLEHVAQEIVYRLSRSDPGNLRCEAASLRVQRTTLLKTTEGLKLKLRAAKNSEFDPVVFNSKEMPPIQVAKLLKQREDTDSWIPSPIEPNSLCPLSELEISDIYALHRNMTPDDEGELAVNQPDIATLINPSDFELLATENKRLAILAECHRPDLWDENLVNKPTADEVRQLYERVQRAEKTLRGDEQWLYEVLYAGWMGTTETWDDLLSTMRSLGAYAGDSSQFVNKYGPKLPEDCDIDDFISTVGQVVDYMKSRKTLGKITKYTKPKWHQLVASCKISRGRRPTTFEEFKALQYKATLLRNRDLFVEQWSRTVTEHDGPSIESVQKPERSAQQFEKPIRDRLKWKNDVWTPLVYRFRYVGFCWDLWLESCRPEVGEYGELDQIKSAVSKELTQIIEAQWARLSQVELADGLKGQREYLNQFAESTIASEIIKAQDTWDVTLYKCYYRELARLCHLGSSYRRREMLLNKLHPFAPHWVDAIRGRIDPHDKNVPPGNHIHAWEWRQWYQMLEERAKTSVNELRDEYHMSMQRIRELSAEIIDRQAWASQRERTSLEQQQMLTGYVQTIGKIGKGLGRRAPKLRREARRLLAASRSAVPVWIMPLSRVYESFDPRRDKFDVVIIDEASQSDVTALAALYLGRSHVVVGDKEQVTPDAVGQKVEDVDRLIETDLRDIPNRHLYDGQISIYDLAEAAFGGVIALREHFRSVPDIIQFSNQLCYNNTIEPLREASSASVLPALVSQRVQGYRTDMTNPIEAEEIASLIVACLEDGAYQMNENEEWSSFGVISLLGDQQAFLIDQKLREQLSPDTYERHRILCGSAAQFQGDERDIVFLSMVDGPPEDGKLPLRGFGPRNMFKKRFNVAVSRARNQLWVVHSISPDQHLKAGDLRRMLIDHARDPQALWREFADEAQHTESEFEKQVLERLMRDGYRVKAQWPVGRFRIDLVVIGHHRRLAVECDGERWHWSEEQRSRDFDRQMLLEQQGWIFVRIRGSLFFRDAERAMEPVFSKLKALGIEPQEMTVWESELPAGVEDVRRRAEELRREWTAMAEEDIGEGGWSELV